MFFQWLSWSIIIASTVPACPSLSVSVPQGFSHVSHLFCLATVIGTALLPNNSVLIREVAFAERERHIHSQYFAAKHLYMS